MYRHLVTESVSAINQVQQPQRLYLMAKIMELPLKMLYDTGADICCLSETMFNKIKAKNPVTSTGPQWQFKAAGGKQLKVLGKYSVPLKIGKKELRHTFFVIKDLSEDAIISIDFIEEHGLYYNPTRRSYDQMETWSSPQLGLRNPQSISMSGDTTLYDDGYQRKGNYRRRCASCTGVQFQELWVHLRPAVAYAQCC